jgi:NAD(P)-dependent dehydrogenase (short-subunit alcohol dehydrogenase family)
VLFAGTGFIAAKLAAEKGAHVLLLNRPSERADKSLDELQKEGAGAFTAVACDLQDFASVRSAIGKLQEQFAQTGIDVLLVRR